MRPAGPIRAEDDPKTFKWWGPMWTSGRRVKPLPSTPIRRRLAPPARGMHTRPPPATMHPSSANARQRGGASHQM